MGAEPKTLAHMRDDQTDIAFVSEADGIVLQVTGTAAHVSIGDGQMVLRVRYIDPGVLKHFANTILQAMTLGSHQREPKESPKPKGDGSWRLDNGPSEG